MLHESMENINKRLADVYGLNLEGRPKYRIVLADTEFEHKKGIYRDWVDEACTILLREVKEVRKVYKYPAHLGYYILEKHVYCPREVMDVKDHNGYEILWVFKKDEKPQPLYWRAVKFLVDSNLKGPRQSLADMYQEAQKIEEDELNYFISYLDNESPYVPGALKSGEAIVVPDIKKVH